LERERRAHLTTPAFAAARPRPLADFDITEVNERHAVPPKSSQLQCEQHALFDPLLTNPASIKTAYSIAAREAGTLYDAGPSTAIELVTPASLTNVATTTALPPQLPSPDNPTGDRLAPGQYVIHREPLVATPYLPDGAAGGVAIRAMPGSALPGVTAPMVLGPSAMVVLAPNQELVLLVAYTKPWPDTTGFRIALAERPSTLADPPCVETYPGNGAPQWDESKRVLTFFVEKGRIVRLRYATFVDTKFVATLGLADWTGTAGDAQFVRNMAHLGCGWMTTPYRSLVLVHATQQPVCAPAFLGLSVQRDLGDQHATLSSRRKCTVEARANSRSKPRGRSGLTTWTSRGRSWWIRTVSSARFSFRKTTSTCSASARPWTRNSPRGAVRSGRAAIATNSATRSSG
jgi:hypothetical protein